MVLADDVVTKAVRDDLPRLQGRFEGFSDGVLSRLRKLEREVAELRRKRTGFVGLEIRIGLHWRPRSDQFDRSGGAT